MEGLRLVGALRRSWLVQGLLELGRRVTLEALDRDGAGEPTAARVKALYAAANFSFSLGDYAGARRFAEESLVIARKLGTLETTCDALRVLGVACFALGDMGAAKKHLQEVVPLARQLRDPVRLAGVCSGLAEYFIADGDLDSAEPLHLEALALNREIGDVRNLAIALGNTALVSIGRRDPERAAEFLREGVSIMSPVQCSGILDMVGSVFALREEWLRAARYFGGAETQRRLSGWRREPVDEAINAPYVARTREALGDTAFEAALAEGGATEAEVLLANAGAWL